MVLFARLMYSLLRTMHERALNGSLYAVLATLSRALSRRSGPQVNCIEQTAWTSLSGIAEALSI